MMASRERFADFFDGSTEFLLGIICLAIPTQMVAELFHWWNDANWQNYDFQYFFPIETSEALAKIEAKGASKIASWLSDIWISLYSIPFALTVGSVLGILSMFIRPNEGPKK